MTRSLIYVLGVNYLISKCYEISINLSLFVYLSPLNHPSWPTREKKWFHCVELSKEDERGFGAAIERTCQGSNERQDQAKRNFFFRKRRVFAIFCAVWFSHGRPVPSGKATGVCRAYRTVVAGLNDLVTFHRWKQVPPVCPGRLATKNDR